MQTISPMKPQILDAFTAAYINTAINLSTDSKDEPLLDRYNASSLTAEARREMIEDCQKFLDSAFNEENTVRQVIEGLGRNFGYSEPQAGYDFWLTRNGHGAGYWARSFGVVGDRLSKMAEAYEAQCLYVGDDNQLHIGEA